MYYTRCPTKMFTVLPSTTCLFLPPFRNPTVTDAIYLSYDEWSVKIIHPDFYAKKLAET